MSLNSPDGQGECGIHDKLIIYSGDKIAATNDYTYHEDPLKQEDSRYLHRGNMDWEKAERRQDPETPEGQIFNAVSSTDNHFYRD